MLRCAAQLRNCWKLVCGSLSPFTDLGSLPTRQVRLYTFYLFIYLQLRDFIQANVETNVKQNEELSKRAIPGVNTFSVSRDIEH
jgi:hypothetical protein